MKRIDQIDVGNPPLLDQNGNPVIDDSGFAFTIRE